MSVATGVSFQPEASGNVRIEFCNEKGETLCSQEVTPGVVRKLPVVSALTDVALLRGHRVAELICGLLTEEEFDRSPPTERTQFAAHLRVEGTKVLHGDGRLICACASEKDAQSVAVALTLLRKMGTKGKHDEQ